MIYYIYFCHSLLHNMNDDADVEQVASPLLHSEFRCLGRVRLSQTVLRRIGISLSSQTNLSITALTVAVFGLNACCVTMTTGNHRLSSWQ